MNREQKTAAIEELKEKFSNSPFFYVADSSTLNVANVNKLRRLCFEKGIEMRVVKNTLIKKALENEPEDKGYNALFEALKGPSTLFFAENGNAPAKLIKEFRKDSSRPILKAAYIDSSVFIGDEELDTLVALKGKNELLGEVIMLLQSPIKNVLGALQSGGQTIAGLVKALQDRTEN
jgi:large subunit ribosomal protein L10